METLRTLTDRNRAWSPKCILMLRKISSVLLSFVNSLLSFVVSYNGWREARQKLFRFETMLVATVSSVASDGRKLHCEQRSYGFIFFLNVHCTKKRYWLCENVPLKLGKFYNIVLKVIASKCNPFSLTHIIKII